MVDVTVQGLRDVSQHLIDIQRSLSALFTQISALQGPTGPQGPAGPAGPMGPQGPTGPVAPGANTIFTGANTFTIPPTINAGSVGVGTILPAGAMSKQASLVGNGNGANTTDDTLFTFTLPANTFDAIGRTVILKAFGTLGATGNNKVVKLWFGSSLVYISPIITSSGSSWNASLSVISAPGGNTQIGSGIGIHGASAWSTSFLTGTETTSAGIVVRVTGASPTSAAAGDVVCNSFQVLYEN